MNKYRKRAITPVLLIFLGSLALYANPLQSWDHGFNPALMSTGNRDYLEMGFSLGAEFSNDYFALSDIFQKEWLIDFNAMSEDLKEDDLSFAIQANLETHLVITVLNVSVGGYTEVEATAIGGIPADAIDIIADGILIDETRTGDGQTYVNVFTTTGIYGGYRWKDWQFSTKIGAYTPVAYVNSDASFTYSAVTRMDGSIEASAGLDLPIYTLFDMNDPSTAADGIMESVGYNIDLGAIKTKEDVPVYGFHLTGVPLSPAKMPYKTQLGMSVSLTAEDLASYEENGTDPWSTDSTDDVEFESEPDLYEVYMPLAAGGFYRLQGYPGFIDWIGRGEIILDNSQVLFNGGISAVGAISPLSALSFSLDYDRYFWETVMGLRFNVRVLEMGLDVGLANTRFVKLFSTNGLYANLYMAIGW